MWKTIEGFSNYEISDKGEVRNRITLLILKGRLSKNGYLQVCIKRDKDNHFINQYIHRLVALSFIPNPESKTEVNHKDRVKTNNTLNNLEWVSHSENQRHIFSKWTKKTSNRKVGMFDIDGNLIKSFNSIVEAYKILNKPSRVNIENALQGKQKTAYGYFWRYLD